MVAEDALSLTALSIQVFLSTYASEGLRNSLAEEAFSLFTPEKFLDRLNDPQGRVRIAEMNDHVIGYATMNFASACPTHDCQSELQTLYIQDRFAGKGIGTMLLHDAVAQAMSASGSRTIWLTVYCENARAIRFYEHHGFKRSGINWYEFGNERYENLVMVRE
jgi:diamine N-acetyltransferase